MRVPHNKKFVNSNFFKKWTPAMAYVLGFIYADGCILNTQESSRTNYIKITNTDKMIVKQIKNALNSIRKSYLGR